MTSEDFVRRYLGLFPDTSYNKVSCKCNLVITKYWTFYMQSLIASLFFAFDLHQGQRLTLHATQYSCFTLGRLSASRRSVSFTNCRLFCCCSAPLIDCVLSRVLFHWNSDKYTHTKLFSGRDKKMRYFHGSAAWYNNNNNKTLKKRVMI